MSDKLEIGSVVEHCTGWGDAQDFNHLMVDLETLATAVDAAIISIGACFFDIKTGEIGPKFNLNIDWQSAIDCGGSVSAGTIKFWMAQSPEAMSAVTIDQKPFVDVLCKFVSWVNNWPGNKLNVWANGPAFDLSKLEYWFDKYNYRCPWHYSSHKDTRTMKMLAQSAYSSVPEVGIKHHALSDAIYQTKAVSAAYRAIKQ